MKQFIRGFKTTGFVLTAFFSFAIMSCNSGNNSGGNVSSAPDSVAAATTTSSTEPVPVKQHAVADLKAMTLDTALSGTADFTTQSDGKVKMKLQLDIPAKANKSVAVHIHAGSDCGHMGNDAGGHWNPTAMQHGKWGSASYHSGDIGNVKLDMNGKGSMELETNLWTLGGDMKTDILNKAIIVHGGEDDFISQPTGNAGGRIGCGVIH